MGKMTKVKAEVTFSMKRKRSMSLDSKPIARRRLEMSMTTQLLPLSPLINRAACRPNRKKRIVRCILFKMPMEIIEKILGELDFLALSNFGCANVYCKALAEQVFEQHHKRLLNLSDTPVNTATTRQQYAQILLSFGHLAQHVCVDMYVYEDMNAETALLLLARYCTNGLERITLMNFELDLVNRDIPNLDTLLATTEELHVAGGSFSNCTALLENPNKTMRICLIENAKLDTPTQEKLSELDDLKALMAVGNITLETQQKWLTNNPNLDFLFINTKYPVPYKQISEMRSVAGLVCGVTNDANNIGQLADLADMEKLKRLQLESIRNDHPDVQPLIDRLVEHKTLNELTLYHVEVTKKTFKKLIMFQDLQLLKLDQAVSTENLPDFFSFINEMAGKNLREFHVKFRHPIAMHNLAFKFMILSATATTSVHYVEDYAEASELLEKWKKENQFPEPHVVIACHRGLIWYKHVVENTEEKGETNGTTERAKMMFANDITKDEIGLNETVQSAHAN